MPNIKSSVLSVRKDAKTNAANTAKKSEMRTAIKKAKLAKTEGAQYIKLTRDGKGALDFVQAQFED